ncbi:MAG: hypothetical protein HZR80_09550 [Candidatus Heimdallarchaeota archaeon]
MFTLIRKQLEEVDNLIIVSVFSKALEIIEEVIKSKEIRHEKKIVCNIYKSDLLNKMGNNQEAFDLIDKILKQFNTQEISTLKINAMIQKGEALFFLDNKEGVKEIINRIEDELSKLKDISKKEITKIEASILKLKLYITSSRIEPKKYLKFAQKCNKLAEKNEDKLLTIFSLKEIALAYYRLNERNKCQENIKEAYKLAISVGSKQEQENCLWKLSAYEPNREKILEYSEKAISIHEENDFKLYSYSKYVYLGCIYVRNCEFEKALTSLHKAEKYLEKDSKESSNIYFIYSRLFNLKGELNLAYENTKRALEIALTFDNKGIVAQSYYDMTLLAIELENLNLAEEHLKELHQLKINLDEEEIHQMYLLASALTLKANKGIRDWSKAIELLEQIIEDEALSSTMLINATLNLCELLIKEIELFGEDRILDSIKSHLILLYDIAEKQSIYWLIIEILRLESQLALLAFDTAKAKELLEEALEIAQEKGIHKLVVEITNEQLEIDEKITILEKLQELDAPLIETIKHDHLINNIKEINEEITTVKSCSGSKNTIEYRKLFALKI